MTTLGAVHFGFALVALGAGLVVCLSRKGTAWHRRWGWTYAAAMIALNVTALSIYKLLGHFGPFHAAAIFSLFTILMGWIPTRFKTNRFWLVRHASWMAGSYVGLWAAAFAETITRTSFLPFWWMVTLATLTVFLVGIPAVAFGVPRAIRGMKGRATRAVR